MTPSANASRTTHGVASARRCACSFREVRGVSWIKVQVMSHSICEEGDPPTIKATGWMAAHAPSGEPTVWFSPNGC